jgi:hypothetical protein
MIIKRRLLVINFSVIILTSLFISCSDKTVDHEKFIETYIDLRIAEDTLHLKNEDFEKIKSQILKEHGFTEAQYKSTFEYFNENPELWEEFYNKAIARVDTLMKKRN